MKELRVLKNSPGVSGFGRVPEEGDIIFRFEFLEYKIYVNGHSIRCASVMKITEDHRNAATGANAERRATAGVISVTGVVVLRGLICMRAGDTRLPVHAGHGCKEKNVDTDQ